MSTAAEIVEDYGIIIGADAESDILIVWPENGVMLQVWIGDGSGEYDNTDVKSYNVDKLTLKEAMERAVKWLDDIDAENTDNDE